MTYGETEHPHAGCRERIAELEAEVEELAKRSALIAGAMASQDEREREAGATCGVSWEEWGCDWPGAVAEKVVALRAEAERLRAEYDDFETHRCPKCDLVIWQTHMEFADGTPAGCPECERLRAEAEIERLRQQLAQVKSDYQAYVDGVESAQDMEIARLRAALAACLRSAEAYHALGLAAAEALETEPT